MEHTEFSTGSEAEAKRLALLVQGHVLYNEDLEEWHVCDSTGEWMLWENTEGRNTDPERPCDAPEGWDWAYVA